MSGIAQITDQRTLRKLLRRVDELPAVKSYLTKISEPIEDRMLTETWFDEIASTSDNLLNDKKVKENQNMTNLIKEIREYAQVRDRGAMVSTARRLLEVPQSVATSGEPLQKAKRSGGLGDVIPGAGEVSA